MECARIRQFSHSCFVLGRERWQKSRNCSCRRKKVLKIVGTRATACHFARCFSGCHEDDSAALLEYFQFEGGRPPRDGSRCIFRNYSRSTGRPWGPSMCGEHSHGALIHCALVALNPTAAFFQSSKTVTLTRQGWKTLKRLLCIFSARHYFCAFMSEKSFWGKVTFMKDKPPGFVHVTVHVYQRKEYSSALKKWQICYECRIKNSYRTNEK